MDNLNQYRPGQHGVTYITEEDYYFLQSLIDDCDEWKEHEKVDEQNDEQNN